MSIREGERDTELGRWLFMSQGTDYGCTLGLLTPDKSRFDNRGCQMYRFQEVPAWQVSGLVWRSSDHGASLHHFWMMLRITFNQRNAWSRSCRTIRNVRMFLLSFGWSAVAYELLWATWERLCVQVSASKEIQRDDTSCLINLGSVHHP